MKPHVVWFPAQWPETYSYTLSAAIDAGLPIVASRIGAFPERLAGRPLTWLVGPAASTEEWRAVFEQARVELMGRRKLSAGKPRKSTADFYCDQYVRVPVVGAAGGLVDLRRPGRISVVVIPERFEHGQLTPCAYIRLLQPLDHPAIGGDFDIVLADAREALAYRADIVVTQRYALPDIEAADALIRHCRDHDMTLLYDLDDDLRHIPREHPDAGLLRPRARLVSRMMRGAGAVWVSTQALAEHSDGIAGRCSRRGERPRRTALGCVAASRAATARAGAHPVHGHRDARRRFRHRRARAGADQGGVRRACGRRPAGRQQPRRPAVLGEPRRHAGERHVFVSRLRQLDHERHWDIGIAPLADTGFNRCKSSMKALDYAAMGLPVLASDRDVYRGTLADGPGGWLLPDDEGAWFVALARPRARRGPATTPGGRRAHRIRPRDAGGTGRRAPCGVAGPDAASARQTTSGGGSGDCAGRIV